VGTVRESLTIIGPGARLAAASQAADIGLRGSKQNFKGKIVDAGDLQAAGPGPHAVAGQDIGDSALRLSLARRREQMHPVLSVETWKRRNTGPSDPLFAAAATADWHHAGISRPWRPGGVLKANARTERPGMETVQTQTAAGDDLGTSN